MTETLKSAIARALATAAAHKPAPSTATDEQVAEALQRMAKDHGYRPSEQVIAPLRDYLTGFGVLLAGDTGTGKTFFFRALMRHICDARQIADWGLARLGEWYRWTDGHEIVIDDLGAESVSVEYGARDDLMKTVLAHRLESQPARTHITTNLSSAQIRERYGDRTLSRILGMCKAHKFTGRQLREAVAT